MSRKTKQFIANDQGSQIPAAPMADRVAYSPSEFAALFGRSSTWGYRQLYAGRIQRLKDCDSILIPRSEVERFLARTARHE